MAQLVERSAVNRQVLGSIPSGGVFFIILLLLLLRGLQDINSSLAGLLLRLGGFLKGSTLAR